MKILGNKFWALGDLNQNFKKKQFHNFCHGKLMAKKWLDSTEKQKRSNVCDRQTDEQMDR